MNFYIIYDNLYQEFQQPFCLKNDVVAMEEFTAFKKNLISKAQNDEEKNKINTRYFIYKFDGLRFDKNDDTASINDGKTFIKAEPFAIGENDE